ncbi:MAG: ABC transporter ATP-binding protein, partial [Actinomycetota bacterium]
IVGIIGPNGAGKTTLFNIITGFVTPTSGRVFFDGAEITGRPPADVCALRIARTFQSVRLFRNMTVWENVWVGQNRMVGYGLRSLLPQRRRERVFSARVDHLLDAFHLGLKRHQLAGALAFGEMRRLELCRALATGPTLLLLDEPASGLTPVETRQLIEDLRGLRDEGLTLMIIEHDMNVAMGLSDRIVVLNFGEKIAEGPPGEVRASPEVVKAYLGHEALAGAHG